MRTILYGLLNLNKEDLRICLTAENEGRYTVQDMLLAFLIFHPFFFKAQQHIDFNGSSI